MLDRVLYFASFMLTSIAQSLVLQRRVFQDAKNVERDFTLSLSRKQR